LRRLNHELSVSTMCGPATRTSTAGVCRHHDQRSGRRFRLTSRPHQGRPPARRRRASHTTLRTS
jgi:hypothetical protein